MKTPSSESAAAPGATLAAAGASANGSSAAALSPAQAARRAWLAVLARASTTELENGLDAVCGSADWPGYDWLRAPETGLAMVRGRIGGSGDPFNLGEATVTRATLRLHPQDGLTPIGVAWQLGRDRRRAECAALLDALLQLPARRAAVESTVITPLAAQQAACRAAQSTAAAATRVEFFTMVRGD